MEAEESQHVLREIVLHLTKKEWGPNFLRKSFKKFGVVKLMDLPKHRHGEMALLWLPRLFERYYGYGDTAAFLFESPNQRALCEIVEHLAATNSYRAAVRRIFRDLKVKSLASVEKRQEGELALRLLDLFIEQEGL